MEFLPFAQQPLAFVSTSLLTAADQKADTWVSHCFTDWHLDISMLKKKLLEFVDPSLHSGFTSWNQTDIAVSQAKRSHQFTRDKMRFFLKSMDLFIWKVEQEMGWGKAERSAISNSFPRWPQKPGWARLKWDAIWVSHKGARGPSTCGRPLLPLQLHEQGWEVEQLGLELACWYGMQSGGFTHCTKSQSQKVRSLYILDLLKFC